jgi:hypothetical protein
MQADSVSGKFRFEAKDGSNANEGEHGEAVGRYEPLQRTASLNQRIQ